MDAVMPDLTYLGRHGKTAWNSEGRKQGQLDSPLLEDGWDHARLLAGFARQYEVDAIFTSPLGRARKTAQVCADVIGANMTVIDELAELHHGSMAGLTWPEIQLRFPGQLEQRQEDKYRWRFPGGESYADVDIRAGKALKLISGARPSRRPLIVSHEMIGRMLVRNLLGTPPEDALALEQPHDIVFEVNVAAGTSRPLSTVGTSESSP